MNFLKKNFKVMVLTIIVVIATVFIALYAEKSGNILNNLYLGVAVIIYAVLLILFGEQNMDND